MVAQPLVSDPPTWTEIPEVLTQFEATTSSITGIEKKMEKVGHVFFSNFVPSLFGLQSVFLLNFCCGMWCFLEDQGTQQCSEALKQTTVCCAQFSGVPIHGYSAGGRVGAIGNWSLENWKPPFPFRLEYHFRGTMCHFRQDGFQFLFDISGLGGTTVSVFPYPSFSI